MNIINTLHILFLCLVFYKRQNKKIIFKYDGFADNHIILYTKKMGLQQKLNYIIKLMSSLVRRMVFKYFP